MAMDHGHPVYFVLFHTLPEPGQTLAGVVDAEAFRNAVLAQRDKASGAGAIAAKAEADPTVALLTEIRDSLRRIEDRLNEG